MTTCKSCKWWNASTNYSTEEDCRRRAPMIVQESAADETPVLFWSETKWARTKADDFCGDWEPMTVELVVAREKRTQEDEASPAFKYLEPGQPPRNPA